MAVSDFYEKYWQQSSGAASNEEFVVEERKEKLLAALAPVPVGSLVLDAGCGNGLFAEYLVALGYQVKGIDIAEGAVVAARQRVPQGTFFAASLEETLPFEDEEFNAIWCTEVFEHLFDVHRAMAELNRVLKPGGHLIFTTPYHGRIKNVLIAMFGFEAHYNPYISHIRFYTRKSLASCLDRAGFSVTAWAAVGRYWPLWMSHFATAKKVAPAKAAPEIMG